MKQSIFKITSNEKIARDIFKMTLAGDTSAITAPGQFVNIKLDGFFLRRPISVCDCVGENLTLIYKTVGRGTEQMSRMAAGDELNLLTGLGNGYDTSKSGNTPLLIGGGVGVPPMYLLAKKLIAEGKKPICVESCPLRALDFGPIAELRAKHGQLAAVAPLPSAHFTRPSIVIKPNANARPCGDTTGYLANPKEV